MNTDPGARLAELMSLLLPMTSCVIWGKFLISLDLSFLNYKVDMKQDLPYKVRWRTKRADTCKALIVAPGTEEVQLSVIIIIVLCVIVQ